MLGFCVASASACVERNVYLVPGSEPSFSTGGTSAGPPPPDPGTGGELSFDASVADRGGVPACVTVRQHQVPQPLGVYMMVDQSPSMQAAWPAVVSALEQFVDDSRALVDVSIGVQFFALTPVATDPYGMWPQTACASVSYAVPDVPIALVPQNEAFLFGALDSHGPTIVAQILSTQFGAWLPDNPMDVALAGGVQGARDWALLDYRENPKPVILLVTAGGPVGLLSRTCDAPLTGAVAAAAAGLAGTPSVPTYVLGVGNQVDSLNQIAVAGGTTAAHIVPSDTADTDILSELQQIRAVALPCELDVDPAALSAGNVNVELGGQSLARVSSETACDTAAVLEWYAGAGGDGGPPQIVLCPSTCQLVRAVSETTLDVAYGCPSVVAH